MVTEGVLPIGNVSKAKNQYPAQKTRFQRKKSEKTESPKIISKFI